MIKNFVKILELLGDRLEVCVSVCRGSVDSVQIHDFFRAYAACAYKVQIWRLVPLGGCSCTLRDGFTKIYASS